MNEADTSLTVSTVADSSYQGKVKPLERPLCEYSGGVISLALQKDDLSPLVEATGTLDMALSEHLFNQLAQSTWTSKGSEALALNANIAMLRGIAPKDEVEGMLAAQMVSIHNMAMECSKRAMLADQPAQGVTENLNRVNKLMRTFTTQLDALGRYRGKGAQKVTVEHVHINNGGQAIVGSISGGK